MNDPLIGFLLGDYRIEECIGKGGMGVIYRARQISLDRPVAIKVLPTELCADRDYVDRFLHEARVAARLNHVHIIQIFEAGVCDGIYFFAMEIVEGVNLGQWITERGHLEEQESLRIVYEVADGLAFAHSMGIVHRDVKPDNIMLTPSGVVKIGDLGLAKWKPNESDISLTASGMTLGTPYYISPEQIRSWKDIDGRSDIYSLGMTLYHMLCGKPAFSEGSPAEIMAQHLSEPMPSLHLAQSHLSQATLDLVAAMTKKDREERIQEMSEVVDILGEILGYVPVYPRIPHVRRSFSSKTAEDSQASWDRVWRISSVAILGIILGLVIALIIGLTHKNFNR